MGLKPRLVSVWPCDELSLNTQRKIVEAPISDFESQVLCDHPELSPQEAKIVAATLLRCSDYASQHGILPDMPAVPSSSSDEVISLSGCFQFQSRLWLFPRPLLTCQSWCIAVSTRWWSPFPGPILQKVVAASNRYIRQVRPVVLPVVAVVEVLNR